VSTRLALSRVYPHGVPAFAAALAEADFHRVKLDVDGSGRIEVVAFERRDGEEGTRHVRVVLRQPVPPGQVPVMVERLLSGVLVIERTEEWTLTPRRCDGRARVVVPGTPISAAGTMSVTPDSGVSSTGSRLSVDLDITASVPLLGGGIERAVVTGIRGLTGTEHDRISRWLVRAEQAR